MPQSISPLRTYRVPYVPAGMEGEDVGNHATADTLPFVQFKAGSTAQAQKLAADVTGAHVMEAQRIEDEEVAA